MSKDCGIHGKGQDHHCTDAILIVQHMLGKLNISRGSLLWSLNKLTHDNLESLEALDIIQEARRK